MSDFSTNDVLPVSDLLSFLEGDWQLSRTINDLNLDMPGTMSGRVQIAPLAEGLEPPVLVYREEGELQFGEYRETVFRVYRYRFPEKNRAEVLFEDDRFFHELDLSLGHCQAEHLCEEDLYRGNFRVLSSDSWQSVWTVTGPKKNLILDNRFQRL